MKFTVTVLGTLLITTFGFKNVSTTVDLITKAITAGLIGAIQLCLTEVEIVNTYDFIIANNF